MFIITVFLRFHIFVIALLVLGFVPLQATAGPAGINASNWQAGQQWELFGRSAETDLMQGWLQLASAGGPSDPIRKKNTKKKRCPGKNCRKDGGAESGDETGTEVGAGESGATNPVNPHGGQQNCIACAVAVDQREAGDDPKAIASFVEGQDKGGSKTGLEKRFGKKFSEVGQPIKQKAGASVSDKQYAQHSDGVANNVNTLFSKKLRKGSRGIILGTRLDNSGHALNVVSRADGVHLIDGQTGKQFKMDSPEGKKYLADQKFASMEVMVTHEPSAPKTPPGME